MKNGFALLMCLLVQLSVGAEPAELTSARANYQKQIQAATVSVNVRYLDYLEDLMKRLGGKGDVQGALDVQKEIDAIAGLQAAQPSAGGDKIVIWNQNNNGRGDRGTKKVSVSLLVGGREVWNKKFVKIDWDAAKPTHVEIPVPTMTADTLRVEITETVNGKGGLSEVEFFRGGRNVARGGAVKVSASWENNPKHAGAVLTDGLQTTFWLLPDKLEGWAEITLKP